MKLTNNKIQLIESALRKIYLDYKNKGILSIYLWGTVLTDDFNPRTSDIDSIAIVDKRATSRYNKKINKFLKGYSKKLKDFKLNFLYLDELNGGKIKSSLAKVIEPPLLLLNFKNWKYVAGKRFHRKNFKLNEISFDEAIKLELYAIEKRFTPLLKKDNFKDMKYFVKYLIIVCYYLNQKESGKHRFRYSELLRRSPRSRKRIVKILLNLKKKNWDKKSMKKNIPILENFINELEKEVM